MATFQQRLEKAMAGGNLRVADLARWFERPHSTVTSWLKSGYQPAGGPMDRDTIASQLHDLEILIRAKKKFPMPRLSPRGRIQYLETVRRAAL